MVNTKLLARRGQHMYTVLKRDFPPLYKRFAEICKSELAPPKTTDLPAIKQGFAKLHTAFLMQNWKQLTVRQAALQTFVGIEIFMWFFLGEVVGRGGWVDGYIIPHTVRHKND